MGTEDRNITSEVEAVLEQYVRPALSAHGGDMEVAGAVELGPRQPPPTSFFYMKACRYRSSLGDFSRLGTNPEFSNLYTTKNRKVTYQ